MSEYYVVLPVFQIRLRAGMYHIFVNDWIQVFGKENVLVLMSETTKAANQRLNSIRQIVKFLEIGRIARLKTATKNRTHFCLQVDARFFFFFHFFNGNGCRRHFISNS